MAGMEWRGEDGDRTVRGAARDAGCGARRLLERSGRAPGAELRLGPGHQYRTAHRAARRQVGAGREGHMTGGESRRADGRTAEAGTAARARARFENVNTTGTGRGESYGRHFSN